SHLWCADLWQSQAHTDRCCGWNLTNCRVVTSFGAAVGLHTGVCDEEERLGLSHRDSDKIAGADLTINVALWRKVHEASIACATTHALGGIVLAASASLDQQFDGGADELLVF